MIPGSRRVGSLGRGVVFLLLVMLVGCERAPEARDAGRLLIFGIDGADWDRAIPLMRQGKMPALARLVRTGTRRTLRSLVPERLSPTIWTTVATGCLPPRHGIHHFVEREPNGAIRPITSNQRRVGALWNILSARDRTVGVLGWLVTWPAEPVNGYMVSSYMPYVFRAFGGGGFDPAADPIKGTFLEGVSDQVWPAELQAELEKYKVVPSGVTSGELRDRFTGRDLPDDPRSDAAKSLEGMRWSWASDETYRRAFHHLARSPVGGRRPEVEMLYFGSVDVISHRFWKYMEPGAFTGEEVTSREIRSYGRAIESAYASLDGVLAGVLGEETERVRVLVLSDHGFRVNRDPNRPTSSGWHRPEGLFVAAGPGIGRGRLVTEGTVVDVTPTVLYALGLPVAEDMDGQPSLELFTEAFRSTQPIERIASYEPEVARMREDAPVASPVDEEILARLEALGYLD